MLRTIGVLTLAASLLALWPGAARADKLDKKLNEEMPGVVKYLKGKDCRNVGVLRFRAQKGARQANFSVGPINSSLPQRLENLLIIHAGDDKGPMFGILHDAGTAAQQQKVGLWYTSAAERKKLFDNTYPLAWGDKKARPDVFLTGRVTLSPDLKKTTVTLEAFTKANTTLAKVTEFTVDTDASVLRDMGYSFALTSKQRATLTRSRSQQQLDDVVVEQVQQTQQKPKSPEDKKPQNQSTPDNIGGIEIKVRSDSEPTEVREASAGDARWQLECPAKGKPIVMTLTNKGDKVRGVVLKVAGLSTIGQEKDESVRCRKWVIPPGKVFEIKGFYVGEEFDKHLPFAVLDGDEARKAIDQLGDRALFIQVDVFENVSMTASPTMTISPRGLPQTVDAGARKSFSQLREELLKSARLKKARGRDGGEVIVPADEKDAERNPPLKVVDFERNPLLIASLTVRVAPRDGKPPQPDPQPVQNKP